MTESENKKDKSKVEFAQAPVNKTNSKTDIDNFVKSFLGYWRRQTPTMKKIHTWRQQLQEIMRMDKNQDELVPNDQKKRLQELAQEVGASTRGIGYHPDGKPYGYPASIAELIDNINQALQTSTFIVNSKYALGACIIAAVAVIISIFVPMWSISVAKKANRITFASLQNSYIPWLQVTAVEPLVSDANCVKIITRCKNFSNAPALNLDIKYSISGEIILSQTTSYDSDALMPNHQSDYQCTITSQNRSEQIVENLKSGKSYIGFDIHFKDIFGREIVIHQERKYIDGNFRMTKYEIDGIDDLFKQE